MVPAVLRRERRLLPRGAHVLRRLAPAPRVNSASGEQWSAVQRRNAAARGPTLPAHDARYAIMGSTWVSTAKWPANRWLLECGY